MSEIKSFYKEYEDMFEEYLEDIIGNLKNKNLNWVLEGQNEGRNLNNYECKMLSKLVQIFYDMKEIEAKELFFLGGNEAYFYFKNMGILK